MRPNDVIGEANNRVADASSQVRRVSSPSSERLKLVKVAFPANKVHKKNSSLSSPLTATTVADYLGWLTAAHFGAHVCRSRHSWRRLSIKWVKSEPSTQVAVAACQPVA